MKSISRARRFAPVRHTGVAVRLGLLLAAAGIALAQVPASITTIPQPVSGQAVLDAAGNVYYAGGLPTPGAFQTQSGGGTCSIPSFMGGSIPVSCPDAHVMKVDPSGAVLWSTLLGGPQDDSTTAIAVDALGNVFFTGSTGGQFPTTPGAAIPSGQAAGSFAARISADGASLVYATALPAAAWKTAAIVVDSAGSAYIAGYTADNHASITRLSSDGSRILYSVTLHGSGSDAVTAIALDRAGNLVLAGRTSSPDFPVTPGAPQSQLRGAQNAFLARLDPSGKLLFCTYLGGSGSETPSAVAIDSTGNVDIAGATSSLDFPTTPTAMQSTPNVPAWNNSAPAGFVAQLSPDGSRFNWASYVMSSVTATPPGSGPTAGVTQMAVLPSGDLYIGGMTGPGFPITPSAPLACFPGYSASTNGFLGHLNSNGALLDATYIGFTPGNDINFVWGLMPLDEHTALVVWHDSGNNKLSTIQFGSAGWTAPPCLSTDVLNAATQVGLGGVSPSELVTLTGFGIGPDDGVAYQPDAQGRIPTKLAGVQVLFDGVAAPVLYAQARQINTVAPISFPTGGVTRVTVIYNNQQLGTVLAAAPVLAPGIFRLQVGQSAQAVALNADGTVNGPSNPAARGSVVTIFATGYGETDPPCVPGGLNNPQGALSWGLSAIVQGGGPVQYAGAAPGLPCGVIRIDFQIPAAAPPGPNLVFPAVQIVSGTSITGMNGFIGATIAVK